MTIELNMKKYKKRAVNINQRLDTLDSFITL